MIKSALDCLPRDLAETYKRMLQSIPENLTNSAKRLLHFLVHSQRPLTLQEAKEVIATNIDVSPSYFDAECRVFEDQLVLQYAPGLISVAEVKTTEGMIKELSLAHFSVKEFLQHQADFGLPAASNIITRTCLTYLKDITSSHDDIQQDFPMARFAAETWTSFGPSAEAFQDSFQAMLMFLEGEETFERLCRLYQPDWGPVGSFVPPTASRLYYVCLAGLTNVSRVLINKGADVNAEGGETYNTALEAASAEGHYDIVKLLLENGADVNAEGSCDYNNALEAASVEGHYEVVKLLLDNGAYINASGRYDGIIAIEAASIQGHYAIVKLLLENGADIDD
ncbi:Pfs NACHT and ankyrin domain protein [Fusarium beomiforme]|uniref:Pfs NACHT and ankyrin domain protein n=1 Tax=Fusarium beomiforme TaxID=44412 RepID=A0A9P5AEL0_9HYPO|nr:Pfs NACHT and ankyrin domain protein [Fusarium beomiforme]